MTIPKILIPRGTNDILPDEIQLWHQIEATAHRLLTVYGYREIRTPYFEETSLFVRSLGQTSDVVEKQMLHVSSARHAEVVRSQDSTLSLRPEATASIVRSYLHNDLDKKEHLSKLYYMGPMFRGERPQKGRLRQFHQIGVEVIGKESSLPFLDAEVISLSVRLLQEVGVEGFKLKINTLGSVEDKKNLSSLLREHLKRPLSSLCKDCQERFGRNVFRILDCKNQACQEVVRTGSLDKLLRKEEHLSPLSRAYFAEVQGALKMLGVSFEIFPYLVRGLDYYTHTVFEISHEALGSQDALGAGGRYDSLIIELGGDPNAPIGAIGFALGMERILLARGPFPREERPSPLEAFIVALDPKGENKAYRVAFKLLNELRLQGISADMNYLAGSLKSQMRLADKLRTRRVIIIGEDELKEGAVTLKDMEEGGQEKVTLDRIVNVLKENIGIGE